MRLDSEEGLNFIEFNYMVLQAYDFMMLFDKYDCALQMGGSDQWGNIVAGIELIRRVFQKTAFGITFPLIMTASGIKMGKTHKGAVWLDADRTTPYEYYQFWVNTDDRDVARFLALFTFLPMAEIETVGELSGEELNCAKAVLAFEATMLAHGREAAVKAYDAAGSMFGFRVVPAGLLPTSAIPRSGKGGDDAVPAMEISELELGDGIPAFKVLYMAGLAPSGGAARRLIQQGGGYMNGERIPSPEYMVTKSDFDDAAGIMFRAGKKRYYKLILRG
jgi:tyrosyl-tRNA synthetase